jgi:peroxiredoxin
LGQRIEEIGDAGAGFAGIAVTATFSQMEFAHRLDLTFPLLSDWGGSTCEAYGVRYDEWKGHAGLAKRSIFVIDGDGMIRYRWVTNDALKLPDLDEPLEVLAGLTRPS